MTLITLGMSGCQMTVNSISSNNSTADDSTGLQGVGVKNYEQIFASMVSATGINPASNNGNLNVYYNTNKPSLPTSNDIQSLQANQLISIMNFASQFCIELINSETNRINFFNGTDFGTTTGTFGAKKYSDLLGSSTQKYTFAEFMLKRFWGEEIAPTVSRQNAINSLVTLSGDLATGFADNNTTLKNAMNGVCAAALGSGPVIYF